MKFSLSANTVKSAWRNNKPFLTFLFYLLLIHSVLKIIFYYYNYPLLWGDEKPAAMLQLIKWSLGYDMLTLLMANTGFLLLLQIFRLLKLAVGGWIVTALFASVNIMALLLNVVDIFYFRFRFQRASADLLYVTNHSFRQVFHFNWLVILLFILAVATLAWLVWLLHEKLYRAFLQNRYHWLTTFVLLSGAGVFILFSSSFSKLLLPAYPLVQVGSNELSAVQNSFHTFSYSLFRKGAELPTSLYYDDAICDTSFPLRKKIAPYDSSFKKNIVLFIMESVPFDFFDSTSASKVSMPFFDSLLKKSLFFENAFCYSHESNKGITAIMSAMPTLTDIPFYHSPYITTPVTAIGKVLKQRNYHSLFCIGDDYDNFGFAKCMNWLAIDNYYCKEDVPGYKRLPPHPMGLQDEHVLPFFLKKLNQVQKPFFGTHYNISTHYPYELPGSYKQLFPSHYTSPMKAMRYYDQCLQQFFTEARKQNWFNETVFIFCSDHWMVPDDNNISFSAVKSYRIPLIIFDPAINRQQTRNDVVSQFDVLGSILALAGSKDSIISYGGNLFNNTSLAGLAFSKVNSNLYQVTDSNYVLGFNIATSKVEYLYNYKKDSGLKINLAANKNASLTEDALTKKIRLFIQKAVMHYSRKPVR